MSFLDSLENNLKNLESREDSSQRDQEDRQQRDAQRAAAIAAAPYAEALKTGPFAAGLLNEAVRIGHGLRTKVHMAWMGENLRLEARERKLELRPTAGGVMAAFIENGHEPRLEPLDLNSDPAVLARQWLATEPEA